MGKNNCNCTEELHGIGMFSFLFHGLASLFGSGLSIRERNYYKNITKDVESGTYLDQYGARRLIKDDSFVQINRNHLGETEIRYQNGVVRNLAQEKYDATPGTVTQLAGYARHERSLFFKEAIGERFKDRATGDIYVIRVLEYNKKRFHFYMNVNNALLVRPTDGQCKLEMEARKKNKKYYTDNDFREMIMYFNNHINNFDKATFYRNENESCDLDDNSISYMSNIRGEI